MPAERESPALQATVQGHQHAVMRPLKLSSADAEVVTEHRRQTMRRLGYSVTATRVAGIPSPLPFAQPGSVSVRHSIEVEQVAAGDTSSRVTARELVQVRPELLP